MPIYFSDNIGKQQGKDLPQTGVICQPFVFTYATALATTGAAGFAIGDFLCLAVIPPKAVVMDYFIDMAEVDTGTTATWDLGDNLILSGAVNGLTSGVQTTPSSVGTSFTLTATASTASFTATHGLLMVNGHLISYAALSGSTFTTCYADTPSLVIPASSTILQAGNTGYYQQAMALGQSAESWAAKWGNITGTSPVTSTVQANALPATYPTPWNTFQPVVPYATGTGGLAQIGPMYLMLKAHASPTGNPAFGTTKLTGWVEYYASPL